MISSDWLANMEAHDASLHIHFYRNWHVWVMRNEFILHALMGSDLEDLFRQLEAVPGLSPKQLE